MSRQSIPSTGLTAVVNPEKSSLDVVFVHGFTGHPVRTWTHNKGDVSQHSYDESEILEPHPKKAKLNLFSKSRVSALPIPVVFPHSTCFAPSHCSANRDIKLHNLELWMSQDVFECSGLT